MGITATSAILIGIIIGIVIGIVSMVVLLPYVLNKVDTIEQNIEIDKLKTKGDNSPLNLDTHQDFENHKKSGKFGLFKRLTKKKKHV